MVSTYPPGGAMAAVPDLIRSARRRHGLSAQQVADRTEGLVSRSTVYQWQRGEATEVPRPDRIMALADALRVPAATVVRAFLADLGLDVWSPVPSVEQSILESELTPEQQDVLLRQVDLFRAEKGQPSRRRA